MEASMIIQAGDVMKLKTDGKVSRKDENTKRPSTRYLGGVRVVVFAESS
jgi:hypothetical protein